MQIANWSAPVGSAARFLLRPGARQKNDESAARELPAGGVLQALPKGLSLRWLGTAGFVDMVRMTAPNPMPIPMLSRILRNCSRLTRGRFSPRSRSFAALLVLPRPVAATAAP